MYETGGGGGGRGPVPPKNFANVLVTHSGKMQAIFGQNFGRIRAKIQDEDFLNTIFFFFCLSKFGDLCNLGYWDLG